MNAVKTLLAAAVAVALLGTGCAKKAVVPDAPVNAPAPSASNTKNANDANKNPTADELDTAVRQAVLHFGFDDTTLSNESQEKLRALAEALRKRPSAAIRITGHADERGTEEYNLALGQRRAAVARKYLVALGVPEKAVDTVSFGAERPAVPGHDEDAWSKNRRAESEAVAK
ncbi:MAG: OmpA family protein [Myxococcaceae bacterium]